MTQKTIIKPLINKLRLALIDNKPALASYILDDLEEEFKKQEGFE